MSEALQQIVTEYRVLGLDTAATALDEYLRSTERLVEQLDQLKRKQQEQAAAAKESASAHSVGGAILRDYGESARRVGDALWEMTKRLSLAGITAVGVTEAFSVIEAARDEMALLDLANVLGVEGNAIQKLDQEIMRLAMTFKVTNKDISEGLKVGRAKWGDMQTAIHTVGDALTFAKAHNISLARSYAALVPLMKGYNIEAEHTAAVSDMLTGAARESAESVEDLAWWMQRIALTGGRGIAGLRENLKMFLMLRQAFGDTRRAFMGLWTLDDIVKTLGEGMRSVSKASPAVQKVFEKLGPSASDAIRDLAQGRIPITEFARQLAILGITDEQISTAFDESSARVLRAITALYRQGSADIERFDRALSESGLSEKRAKMLGRGLIWRLTEIRNVISNLGTEISKSKVLEPLERFLGERVEGLVARIQLIWETAESPERALRESLEAVRRSGVLTEAAKLLGSVIVSGLQFALQTAWDAFPLWLKTLLGWMVYRRFGPAGVGIAGGLAANMVFGQSPGMSIAIGAIAMMVSKPLVTALSQTLSALLTTASASAASAAAKTAASEVAKIASQQQAHLAQSPVRPGVPPASPILPSWLGGLVEKFRKSRKGEPPQLGEPVAPGVYGEPTPAPATLWGKIAGWGKGIFRWGGRLLTPLGFSLLNLFMGGGIGESLGAGIGALLGLVGGPLVGLLGSIGGGLVGGWLERAIRGLFGGKKKEEAPTQEVLQEMRRAGAAESEIQKVTEQLNAVEESIRLASQKAAF